MEEKKKKKPVTVETFDMKFHVTALVRGAFKRTPMYHAAREAAKTTIHVGYTKKDKPIMRVAYVCAHCGKAFRNAMTEPVLDEDGEPAKKPNGRPITKKVKGEIAVDHIDPVVPVTGWVSWDDYLERLHNGRLQILCNYKGERDNKKSCHSIKTKAENKVRALNAKQKKVK